MDVPITEQMVKLVETRQRMKGLLAQVDYYRAKHNEKPVGSGASTSADLAGASGVSAVDHVFAAPSPEWPLPGQHATTEHGEPTVGDTCGLSSGLSSERTSADTSAGASKDTSGGGGGDALAALPVDELVRRIQAGTIAVKDLPVELRIRCVGALTIDGFTTDEIVCLLSVSERTVRRDRAAARRDHAIAPGRSLGDELLGEFARFTLASVQRLIRFTREPAAPGYARLWAEEAIVRNYQRLLDTARRMGYTEPGRERRAREKTAEEKQVDLLGKLVKLLEPPL